MMATHNLSKPLNVFTPQAHKPTTLNLHPNNVTILSSSISGGNWRVLRQEMCLRDHLQPTETMGLSGPDPKAVATKNPITRMCMCQDKRVPSSRSLTLEFLRGGPLSVAKRARLTPHSLDDAECKFKEILWQSDRVEFKDLEECARWMEMSRKEDAAVKELSRYILKLEGGVEHIYEVQMLLVEMLIYQAVIYVLLGKEDEAKQRWNEFIKKSEEGFGASTPSTDDETSKTPTEDPDGKDHHISESGPSKTPMDEAFSQFKKHVKVLGQEIAAVRKKKGFGLPLPKKIRVFASSKFHLCIAELLRRTRNVIQFLREEIKRERERMAATVARTVDRNMKKALAGLRRINLEGLRWRVFDAKGQILGRLASQISTVIQGKDKPTYTPYREDGDMCIVLNAKDICVTGRKLTDKFYRWHTGYIGHLKERSLKDQMAKDPTEVIRKAVLRMLPRNKLRDDRDRKLRIFTGSEHPFGDRPLEPYVMPSRQVREMRPRARRALIRAQKKAEQGPTANRKKKREETSDTTALEMNAGHMPWHGFFLSLSEGLEWS
ncbi:hypothetical protein AAC387_Pa05g0181 [Persea americana]